MFTDDDDRSDNLDDVDLSNEYREQMRELAQSFRAAELDAALEFDAEDCPF